MEASSDTSSNPMSEQFGDTSSHRVRPRSFFTRKIESKLEQQESDIPFTYLALLDTPFNTFTPEQQEFYENKIKPTFQSFSQILLEVFDELGCPEEGWEESTKLMPDCPAKVVAMLALYEYRQTNALPEDPLNIIDDYAPPPDQPAQQVRSPMERIVKQAPPPGAHVQKKSKKSSPGQDGEKSGKWWEKKVF
jgi:hypothetical protein